MAELVAVVCVVESSLILASEWNTILTEYILPLFKRLGETHAAQLVRHFAIPRGRSALVSDLHHKVSSGFHSLWPSKRTSEPVNRKAVLYRFADDYKGATR